MLLEVLPPLSIPSIYCVHLEAELQVVDSVYCVHLEAKLQSVDSVYYVQLLGRDARF